MKIYTISYDCIEDGETGNTQCEVIGAYTTIESARKHLKEVVDKAKANELNVYYNKKGKPRNDCVEEATEDSFCIYVDYEYNMTHTLIYIEEIELEE